MSSKTFQDLLECKTVILQILLHIPQEDLLHFAGVNKKIRNIFRQPNVKLEYYKRTPILKVKSLKEAKLYLEANPKGWLHIEDHRYDICKDESNLLEHEDIKNIGARVLYLDYKDIYSIDYLFDKLHNLKTRISHYANGQKKIERNFKGNLLHGKSYGWYESGKRWFEENFKEGFLDGKAYGWYEDGKTKYENTYEKGALKTLVPKLSKF